MVGTRTSATMALIVCLAASPLTETLAFAEDAGRMAFDTAPEKVQPQPLVSAGRLVVGEHTMKAMNVPLQAAGMNDSLSAAFAQRGWYRGRGRRGDVARTEMLVGTIAAITGAAVLVYANRPECTTNHAADGCGYGTKVIGSAVTAAGLVTFFAGAVTWR